MKKIISLLFCLVLGTVALTGCSGNDEPFPKRNTHPARRKSRKSVLTCGTDRMKFRCQRIIRFILRILKTARNPTTLLFQTMMY